MVPASIFMLLLCLIPAIMSAIAVVREKETGSIANFRSTPITRFEYLIGKQLPYVAVAMIAFFALLLIAIFIFRVPPKGSFCVLLVGTLVYVVATVGFGVLISSFTRTQVAAVLATADPFDRTGGQFLRNARAGLLALRRGEGDRPVVPLVLVPADFGRHLAKALGIVDLWRRAVAPRSRLSPLSSWPFRWPCFASRRHEMSEAPYPKPRISSKPATGTFVTSGRHSSIWSSRNSKASGRTRSMLVLVVYSFSISVNRLVDRSGDEATNLSVGSVDEDGSICRGASPRGFGCRPSSHRCRSRLPTSIR